MVGQRGGGCVSKTGIHVDCQNRQMFMDVEPMPVGWHLRPLQSLAPQPIDLKAQQVA